MKTKQIIMGLVLFSIGLVAGGFFKFEDVTDMKLYYASCEEGILNADRTYVLSIAGQTKVVHSLKEATTFMHGIEGKPKVMVMNPSLGRIIMDDDFCSQPQATRDEMLLAAVKAKLSK